jgi:hypothetical protein
MDLVRFFLRPVEWFMKTKAWEWLSGKFLNHITFRFWGYPAFELDPGLFEIERAVRAWHESGKTGVVAFVCTDRASLTGRLIRTVTGGQFSHAGVLRNGWSFPDMKALHMVAAGMKHEHPVNVFSEADEVRVVGFPMTAENAALAEGRISNLLALRDVIRYDFEQRLGNETRIYCSELVLLAIQGLVPPESAIPTEIAGRPVFTPDSVAAFGELIFERRLKK